MCIGSAIHRLVLEYETRLNSKNDANEARQSQLCTETQILNQKQIFLLSLFYVFVYIDVFYIVTTAIIVGRIVLLAFHTHNNHNQKMHPGCVLVKTVLSA